MDRKKQITLQTKYNVCSREGTKVNYVERLGEKGSLKAKLVGMWQCLDRVLNAYCCRVEVREYRLR